MRQIITSPIKKILSFAGYNVMRQDRYGYDAYLDISRLATTWETPIRTAFDVGANVGHASTAIRENFKNSQIFAFEPHPPTFKILVNNMQNISGVNLINSALGSDTETKTMFEYDHCAMNSLVENAPYALRKGAKANKVDVSCTTLDQFCMENNVEKIDMLKIDTEGHDFNVLKGAISMLQKQAIRFIYFEFNSIQQLPNASGGAILPIDELLTPFGYKLISTYTDYVIPKGELFLVANALYALPPAS